MHPNPPVMYTVQGFCFYLHGFNKNYKHLHSLAHQNKRLFDNPSRQLTGMEVLSNYKQGLCDPKDASRFYNSINVPPFCFTNVYYTYKDFKVVPCKKNSLLTVLITPYL